MELKHANTAPSKINRGISLIIYADPGIGKTTLATTLPEGETLIINTEAGLGPLLGTKHVVFDVGAALVDKNLEEVMSELYQVIRTGQFKVKNVVIDNISHLIGQLTIHYTESRTKEFPELKEYGDTAYKMMEWIHNWNDLRDMGINVVFNAWEYAYDLQNNNGTIITKTGPLVGKSSVGKICGIVDLVGHMEVFEKTGARWVRFQPSQQYITKCQFKGLDPKGEEPNLTKIIDKLKAYDYSKESK